MKTKNTYKRKRPSQHQNDNYNNMPHEISQTRSREGEGDMYINLTPTLLRFVSDNQTNNYKVKFYMLLSNEERQNSQHEGIISECC